MKEAESMMLLKGVSHDLVSIVSHEEQRGEGAYYYTAHALELESTHA